MKAIKRTFLDPVNHLNFTKKNGFIIERYFAPLTCSNIETAHVHFEDSYGVKIENITIEALYLDSGKNIMKHEAIEFHESKTLNINKVILKKDEINIPLKTRVKTKVLWKLRFKVEPQEEKDVKLYILLQ